MKRTQRVEYKRTKSAILELLLRDFDFEAQYFLAQNRPFSRERSLKTVAKGKKSGKWKIQL